MNAQYQLLPDLTEDEFAALKASIASEGVLVPIELDDQGNVLDGHHRLLACAELGLTEWPSIIRPGLSEEEKTEHVLALNLDRRHLSQQQRAELVARLRGEGWSLRRIAERIGVGVATVDRDLAAGVPNGTPERVTGDDGKSYPARRPAVIAHNPRAAEKAIETLGDLDLGLLPDGLSDSRRVERVRRQWADKPEPPPVPEGKFAVVYADPPWEYANSGLHGSAAEHYPTMSTETICALPVSERLAANAVLFLWATNPLLSDALRVVQSWGFEYKTNFAWVKDRQTSGLSFYNFGKHELLFVAVKGSALPADDGKVASVFAYDKREHSRKPEEVYGLIEGMYPTGPFLELFARATREGWTSWGNEVDKWA